MKFLLLATIVATTLLTAAATAQDVQLYDVEIIVFRHVDADTTEQPVQDRRLGRDGAEEVERREPIRRRQFPAVATDQLRLGSAARRLLSSDEWSSILHSGWRQPAEVREDAAAMSVAGTRQGAAVSGTVRLSLDRYLRLELDLALDPGTSEKFRIDQARRIRSGEVHYFDHPQFGVIATVNPVR